MSSTLAKLVHMLSVKSMPNSLDWQLVNNTDSIFINMETCCRDASPLVLTITHSVTHMRDLRMCRGTSEILAMSKLTSKVMENITSWIIKLIFMDPTL